MFKLMSICTHARSQSLSLFVDGRVNNVLQTVPDFNQAQLQLINTVHTTFIHSLLHNTPTGLGSGLFVGQRSGPLKSIVSCCSSLMVLLAWWDEALSCWKTNIYHLQHAWSLAASAKRVRHRDNTGRWLSFQSRQRSTQSYPFSTQQCKP